MPARKAVDDLDFIVYLFNYKMIAMYRYSWWKRSIIKISNQWQQSKRKNNVFMLKYISHNFLREMPLEMIAMYRNFRWKRSYIKISNQWQQSKKNNVFMLKYKSHYFFKRDAACTSMVADICLEKKWLVTAFWGRRSIANTWTMLPFFFSLSNSTCRKLRQLTEGC